MVLEELCLGDRPHPIRMPRRADRQALDRRQGLNLVPEQVEAEIFGEILTHLCPPDAVATIVDQRREHAESRLARDESSDASGDATLRRQSRLEGPLAGVVVHAGGEHDAQDVTHGFLWKREFSRDRVTSTVGERRRHHREIPARHQDRALPEVHVEDLVDLLAEHSGGTHEVGDGPIPMAGGTFRLEDRLVDRERAAREDSERREDSIETLSGAFQRGHRRDRPGIDHRVVWPVRSIEHDGVERLAARLDAHSLQHPQRAVVCERQRVDEWLRHRLDRELLSGISGVVDVTVDGAQAHPNHDGSALASSGM